MEKSYRIYPDLSADRFSRIPEIIHYRCELPISARFKFLTETGTLRVLMVP